MNRLVISNLIHRPLRSLISIFAIALEVTLILLIAALSYGMLNDSKTRQAGIGADLMVQPPGSSNLVGFTTAPMSVKVGDVVAGLSHVTVVSPVLWTLVNNPGSLEIIYGIDLASYESLGTPFTYIAGAGFQAPEDMIVDDKYAGDHHSKIGDPVTLLNHKFRICGIVEHGKGARRFLQLSALQDLLGAQGKASVLYVRLDDPKNADAVVAAVKGVQGMETYTVHSTAEFLSLMTPEHLPGFNLFIKIVVGVAMVIGFMVIFQSMYTAVMERTREIGILKSMGASQSYILRVILRETLLLAIAGIALGIAISYTAKILLTHKFHVLPLLLTGEWVFRASVLALVGAMLGAIYPAIKAARKDPIDALAYE
jgi:putative ABC transport system permease protein